MKEKSKINSIGPKITLNRSGCPESVPDKFHAEINVSRYGIAQNAIVSIRFRDPDTQKSTRYKTCRAVEIRPMPTYMDGKRSKVTFVSVEKKGGL